MREESTLLSDFDIAIDDSLLTSEPDFSAANNIEQITEIALSIGKRLGSNCTDKKNNTTRAKISGKHSYKRMWGPDLYFSGALSVGLGLVPLAQCVATLPSKIRKKDSGRQKVKTKIDVHSKKTSPKNILIDSSQKSRTLRSKQGCWTCRLRHKACPEDGNPCGTCARLGLDCDVSRQRPSYMVDGRHTMERLKEIRGITDKLRKQHRKSRHEMKNI